MNDLCLLMSGLVHLMYTSSLRFEARIRHYKSILFDMSVWISTSQCITLGAQAEALSVVLTLYIVFIRRPNDHCFRLKATNVGVFSQFQVRDMILKSKNILGMNIFILTHIGYIDNNKIYDVGIHFSPKILRKCGYVGKMLKGPWNLSIISNFRVALNFAR